LFNLTPAIVTLCYVLYYVIIIVVLCGSECWTMQKHDEKGTIMAEMSRLCKISRGFQGYRKLEQ